MVVIQWHGRPARAWVPEPLTRRDIVVAAHVAPRTDGAAADVRRLGDRLPDGSEPLARLLLRAEGLASSSIEGLHPSVAAAAAAELDEHAASGDAAWVTDNLAVIGEALDAARAGGELTEGELHRWHARLMRHGTLDARLVGVFRDRQGWIGGPSPRDAAYVPPPADHILSLMDDLLAFANRTDIDPVNQAAVLHGQFETIHPYGDGNGRIGRLLVLWVLARRMGVAVPPAISVLIARDMGGYLAGLHWFRNGPLALWVQWFARTVRAAAAAAMAWADEVDALMAGWRHRVADLHAESAARAVLELLPAHPVVSTGRVAELLGVSDTAARAALAALARRAILEPYPAPATGPGRPRRWWLAGGLADLVGSWAR